VEKKVHEKIKGGENLAKELSSIAKKRGGEHERGLSGVGGEREGFQKGETLARGAKKHDEGRLNCGLEVRCHEGGRCYRCRKNPNWAFKGQRKEQSRGHRKSGKEKTTLFVRDFQRGGGEVKKTKVKSGGGTSIGRSGG